jgi:hypothetical protein
MHAATFSFEDADDKIGTSPISRPRRISLGRIAVHRAVRYFSGDLRRVKLRESCSQHFDLGLALRRKDVILLLAIKIGLGWHEVHDA